MEAAVQAVFETLGSLWRDELPTALAILRAYGVQGTDEELLMLLEEADTD